MSPVRNAIGSLCHYLLVKLDLGQTSMTKVSIDHQQQLFAFAIDFFSLSDSNLIRLSGGCNILNIKVRCRSITLRYAVVSLRLKPGGWFVHQQTNFRRFIQTVTTPKKYVFISFTPRYTGYMCICPTWRPWIVAAKCSFNLGSNFNVILSLILFTVISAVISSDSFICPSSSPNNCCYHWIYSCCYSTSWTRLCYRWVISVVKLLKLTTGRSEQLRHWKLMYQLLISAIQMST